MPEWFKTSIMGNKSAHHNYYSILTNAVVSVNVATTPMPDVMGTLMSSSMVWKGMVYGV